MEGNSRTDRHAVLIVTYNRAALLRECVEAILAQTRAYDDVLIVDNASTDGTSDYLSILERKERFHIVRERKNLGGAGGFSEGLRHVHTLHPDWITIIDDDAVLEPDFLEQIERAIGKYGRSYRCFAGVPLTDGIRRGHRRRVQGRILKKETAVPYEEYRRESFSCEIGSFCGLVMADSLIPEIGYPDARYFIWYDDTEYCLRIAEHTRILNWNKAVIQHKAVVDDSGSYVVGWKEYYGIRNRIHMAGKHYGLCTKEYIILRKRVRGMLLLVRLLLKGKPREAMQTAKLYHCAIRDGKRKQLGLHPVYRPGYKP